MKKRFRLFLVSASVFALDQAIKAYVSRFPGLTLLRLPGILEIVPVYNEGIAFSLLSGRTALIAAASVLLMAFLLAFAFGRMRLTAPAKIALMILMGGGAGNLADRLTHGYVIDYVRLLFVRFAVFNFADICITLSIAVLMLLLLSDTMEEKPSGKQN